MSRDLPRAFAATVVRANVRLALATTLLLLISCAVHASGGYLVGGMSEALFLEAAPPLAPVVPTSFDPYCDSDQFCTPLVECREPYLYLSGIAGASFMHGESGGFNTEGSHFNTNSTNDDLFFAGGAFGLGLPQSYGALRIEAEARGLTKFEGVTDSFEPPTPTFFYDVEMRDGWSTMANAWYDFPVCDRVAVYLGGGLGAAGYKLNVDDTVVAGSDRVTEFAWQLGAGAIYRVTDCLMIDVGYRFCDLGTADIPLSRISDGNPSGNYTFDVTSHEVVLQLRVNDPFSIFRYRPEPVGTYY